MTSLHILLEARSAVRRCWRAYEIEVGADLFGAWLVEMSYGRIGTMGRSKIRSFATAADAQAEVDRCLRKRASAPRRIGVAYRLRRASQARYWSHSPDSIIGFARGSVGWMGPPSEPDPVAGSNRGHATTYVERGFLFSQGRNRAARSTSCPDGPRTARLPNFSRPHSSVWGQRRADHHSAVCAGSIPRCAGLPRR